MHSDKGDYPLIDLFKGNQVKRNVFAWLETISNLIKSILVGVYPTYFSKL